LIQNICIYDFFQNHLKKE